MPVLLSEAIADAIMQYEGWKAGSRSNRNRNPGNLRASAPGQQVDKDGYRVFVKLSDGWDALVGDIAAKIDGKDTHGLGPSSTLLDFFKVYAPSDDSNDPQKYCGFVAAWLEKVYVFNVTRDTTFAKLAAMSVWQEKPSGVSAA